MYDLNMGYSRNFALNTAFLFFLFLPGQAIHSQNYDKKIEKYQMNPGYHSVVWSATNDYGSQVGAGTVSYTHLTLPTICSV